MSDRIEALRTSLDSLDCDAFVSVHPPTNQYLSGLKTGFEEISSVVIVTQGKTVFLCDSRYTEQARNEVVGFEPDEISGDQLLRAGERLTSLDVRRAAFDPNGHTVAEHETLAGAFKGELVAQPEIVAALRRVKDPEEIAHIRAASNLAEGVLRDVLPTLEAGVPEREVAAHIEYEFKKRGATGPSFDTIALFGANSSLPHGIPGDQRLEEGDTVLIDMGCRHGGYCSDLTRTYTFSTIPGAWFEEIYALTKHAQVEALQAVRPGVTGREVDTVARGIIKEGGYGDRFGHGLGHGVGIEIHEAPRINPHSDTVLEPGMVITIEPGIYIPGQGGVRIEDLVVVTQDGCEVLTQLPKDLQVL